MDLLLGQLNPCDRVVAPHDWYGGTYRLLAARIARGSFNAELVDQGDDTAMEVALTSPTSLIYVEMPSNPLMRAVDIRKISNIAKSVGAKMAVDNTFLSPALQNPIALGADFVVHSLQRRRSFASF